MKMTREGAKKVREALKVILEQCRATDSCENCPCIPQHPTARCYTRDCCDDLFECVPYR